ncbi:MAG: leucine-rich repeat protein, partial [Prevotella sp.]|nr:leucine-rich repeat protein [Prevotella sp.]
SGLTSVTIPNSVTSIGSWAFYNCSGLTSVTIPNSVTSIGDRAFYNCSGLTSVTIPNSVTSIGSWAFYNCSGLTSVTIPNSVTSIGSWAFSGCSGLTSVTIPNSVTSINSYAFYGCSGQTSVTIPESVTSIGDGVFSSCSGLTEIKVADGNNVYDSRNNCNAIINTSSNTLIAGCKNTIIPNSVTSIGSNAFDGCSGLTSVTIPNSVTSIGSAAFYGCSGLASVTIPNSVTSIVGSAFSSCSGLKSATIPNSVTSIGDNAFKGCSRLTSVTIPNSVTSIGSSAFEGCRSLTSVTIPNSVTSIGSYAFYDCSGLTSITWNAKNYPAISSYSSSPFYDIRTQIKKFIIGDDVTSIPSYMCYEMSNLKSVIIPNSVTSIGAEAFNKCRGLTSVTIPNSVTSIGAEAFIGCSGLTSVTIPNSVTTISSSAFDGCRGLKSVTIPNSVTSIGSSAFYNCSGLTSVTIGNSVTSIGSSAFYRCGLAEIKVANGNSVYDSRNDCNAIIETSTNTLIVGCKNTIIPNSVTSIGNYAFASCSGLTSVIIPNSVTSIGFNAFYRCSGLTSVTIPNSVTSIGNYAFNECYGLTSVKVMRKEAPSISYSAFPSSTIIYVPYGSKAKYEAAQYWKDFNIRMLSDSNGDDMVNAKDYSGVANYIMGETPEAFDAEAGDVDVNGTVDVRDNVGIANIITTGSIYGGTSNNAKAAMSKGMALPATDESDAENVIYVENVSGSKNSQVELSVRMRNASDIRGFQFDLYLPEGVSMATNAKASLSSDRLAAGDAHTLMVNEISDGAVRFLCSSMNDESFAGGDGEIATLTVNIADNVANGDYDVVVKNAIMTETDISKSYEADNIKSTLTVLDQTGVETVTADDERRDGTIYTVGGQLVGKKSTTSQLRKGIYIRNGKKFVVK